MKKTVSFFLALLMCALLLPSLALAEEAEPVEGVVFDEPENDPVAIEPAAETVEPAEEESEPVEVEPEESEPVESVEALTEQTVLTADAEERYLEISKANFPDYYLRYWIIETLEVSGNETTGYYMTEEQAKAVTSINFENGGTTWTSGIQSLEGITLFPALQSLKVCKTKVTSIDLSGCKTLKTLDCESSYLFDTIFIAGIDVSGCTALTTLKCSNNDVTELNVSGCTSLQTISCNNHMLTSLDLTTCPALQSLSIAGHFLYDKRGPLTHLDLSKNTNLQDLDIGYNMFTELDLSKNTSLVSLYCARNYLSALDLHANTLLTILDCRYNQIEALDLSCNPELRSLQTDGNRLAELDLDNNPNLSVLNFFHVGYQTITAKVNCVDGQYTFNLRDFVHNNFHRVEVPSDAGYTLDPETGIVTLSKLVSKIRYDYRTAYSGDLATLHVSVVIQYDINGTIEWNEGAVQYKGSTPYVIADGYTKKPGFTVKDDEGNVIDSRNYSYEFKENKNAGTAYLFVTFTNGYYGSCSAFFKIYLPATQYTAVENRDNGIYIEWDAVRGAAGYVIYRRAWSSTTNGWTDFVRWNNTTERNWTDTNVYAGTRYQYGIKAYFDRRVDPVSGATIGGNVGDNYNLGMVGPLKTTVRITTRTLNSVTGGTKQITVKWGASKIFTGYEVQIATNADFSRNVKTVKITNPKTSQTTIKNLNAKTTYYVRVRSYHVFNGTTYYGGWSNVKNNKTK